jgi:hypothetical protein
MLWGHCDDPCRFAIGFSNKLIFLFTCIYLNLLLTEPFSAFITDAVIVAVGRAAAAAARVPALCARLPELVRLPISFEVKTLLNFSIIIYLKPPFFYAMIAITAASFIAAAKMTARLMHL